MVPLSNFRKHNPDVKELVIGFTILKTSTPRQPPTGEEALAAASAKCRPTKENDFELISVGLPQQSLEPTHRRHRDSDLRHQLDRPAGGGIGVMNIMLISVTERTREIGIRKAIGPGPATSGFSILLEAVTQTVAGGGLIGIALGAAVARIVRSTLPSIPASVSVFWIAMGTGLSGGVGLFFGYWPADRAARLDPIVCLRYE